VSLATAIQRQGGNTQWPTLQRLAEDLEGGGVSGVLVRVGSGGGKMFDIMDTSTRLFASLTTPSFANKVTKRHDSPLRCLGFIN